MGINAFQSDCISFAKVLGDSQGCGKLLETGRQLPQLTCAT